MGYQETWFYITPQSKFDEMVRACHRLERAGRYRELDTRPTDVVTLKEPLGGLPAGSRVIWVCGERCFQRVDAILEKPPAAGLLRRCRVQIIPVEQALPGGAGDVRLLGIDLDSPLPCENATLRCQSFGHYASQVRQRERVR